MLVQVRSG